MTRPLPLHRAAATGSGKRGISWTVPVADDYRHRRDKWSKWRRPTDDNDCAPCFPFFFLVGLHQTHSESAEEPTSFTDVEILACRPSEISSRSTLTPRPAGRLFFDWVCFDSTLNLSWSAIDWLRWRRPHPRRANETGRWWRPFSLSIILP